MFIQFGMWRRYGRRYECFNKLRDQPTGRKRMENSNDSLYLYCPQGALLIFHGRNLVVIAFDLEIKSRNPNIK